MEREEVRALLALDVDDLDELACAHLVRQRSRGIDADVEPGLGQRRRELLLLVRAGRGRAHLDEELGGRRRAVDDAARRRGDDDGHGALRAERLRGAGRRPPVEEPDRERLRGVEPTRAELVCEQTAVAIGERGPDHGRRRVRPRLERGRVVASVAPESTSPRRPDRRTRRRPSRARPAPSANTVAPPGRTRYVSTKGSSGRRPRTRAGVPVVLISGARPAPSPPSRPPRRSASRRARACRPRRAS